MTKDELIDEICALPVPVRGFYVFRGADLPVLKLAGTMWEVETLNSLSVGDLERIFVAARAA